MRNRDQGQEQARKSKKSKRILWLLLIAFVGLVVCPTIGCIWWFFKVKNSLGYSVEGNKVYYTTLDEAFGYRKQLIGTFDPETIDHLSDGKFGYAKDKDHCYFNYRKLKEADLATFELIPKTEFARDKNTVYYKGNQIKQSDPKTFKVLGPFLSRDSKQAYYWEKSMKSKKLNVDPESIRYLGGWYWCDKSHIYQYSTKIENSDPESAEYLAQNYVKDKNSVYRKTHVIKEADPQSFRYLEGPFGIDKTSAYCHFDPIEGSDPKTFVVDNARYGKSHDKYRHYHYNKPRR